MQTELDRLRELYRVERCDDVNVCVNVKLTQLRGEMKCCRLPGHVGKHWDVVSGEMWE